MESSDGEIGRMGQRGSVGELKFVFPPGKKGADKSEAIRGGGLLANGDQLSRT